MTLSEQFERERSGAWEDRREDVIRFTLDDGSRIGLRFERLIHARWFPDTQRVILKWEKHEIQIVGPKSIEFFNAFCEHTASCIQKDDKDIMSVKLVT